MNYTEILDFNNVLPSKPEFSLIPVDTIAKAHLTIRGGGYEADPYLTKSSHTGSIYLAAEFCVLEGPFSRRKIFQNFGVSGTLKEGDNDSFGKKGRSLIRSIIESAKNINPNDNSDEAQKARKINNFGDLNGITCIIKIGIDHDKSGKYNDRNCIIGIITPDKKEYQQIMNGTQLEDQLPWC